MKNLETTILAFVVDFLFVTTVPILIIVYLFTHLRKI